MRCEGTALHCAVAALAGEDVAEKFVTPLILLLFVGFVVYTQLESIIEHVSGSGKKVKVPAEASGDGDGADVTADETELELSADDDSKHTPGPTGDIGDVIPALSTTATPKVVTEDSDADASHSDSAVEEVTDVDDDDGSCHSVRQVRDSLQTDGELFQTTNGGCSTDAAALMARPAIAVVAVGDADTSFGESLPSLPSEDDDDDDEHDNDDDVQPFFHLTRGPGPLRCVKGTDLACDDSAVINDETKNPDPVVTDPPTEVGVVESEDSAIRENVLDNAVGKAEAETVDISSTPTITPVNKPVEPWESSSRPTSSPKPHSNTPINAWSIDTVNEDVTTSPEAIEASEAALAAEAAAAAEAALTAEAPTGRDLWALPEDEEVPPLPPSAAFLYQAHSSDEEEFA
eukprot:m.83157 g.83157  ORF g.83157 m.83157 type:complete len:403 (-) comp19607_c0_seq1:2345-3553(-)